VLAAALLIGIIALLSQSTGSSTGDPLGEPSDTASEAPSKTNANANGNPGLVNARQQEVEAAYATRK